MRIVQIANFVSPTSGGLRTTLRHLAAGYTQQGHEVVQVFPAKSDGHAATAEASQLLLRSPLLGSTGYRIHLDIRRVRRVLDRLAPDVLEVHDRTTLRGAGAWARASGIPSAAVSHERMDRWLNQWLPGHLPLEMIADRSNAGLARAFDTIVCTTAWAAQEFRRLGIRNLSTIPLGVDHDEFTARLEGLRASGVLLIMTSRLSREKRPEIAVETVRELVRRRVDVRLIVAGDGPMRRELEQRAGGLPILWLGFVAGRAELAGLLRAADVALAPGPVETFGLAALEALACGTPAVVNWRSALPEIVGPVAGRSVAGSGFTFADAVQDLLAEPEIPLRRAARARAEEFGWNATVQGFFDLHQRARRAVAV